VHTHISAAIQPSAVHPSSRFSARIAPFLVVPAILRDERRREVQRDGAE
jgi:hypothetical protein